MCDSAPPIRPAFDPGPHPVALSLADLATRHRLRLAEIWRLTSAEACALLGDVSERTWFGPHACRVVGASASAFVWLGLCLREVG